MAVAEYAPPTRLDTIATYLARESFIIHPIHGRIPFRARTCQRRFWADKSQLRIALKARQIGFSQAVGGEAIWLAMNSLCKILIVSRSEDLAVQVLEYAKIVYRSIENPICEVTAENMKRLEFANGSMILSLPASKRTGRGYAASHVYIDEGAFMPFADEIFRAVSPATALGGTITLLSSPDGPANLMGRIWLGQRGGVKDYDGTPAPPGVWSRHHYTWRDNPEYTEEWAAIERRKHTEEEWQSEFEASLVSSGERVFPQEHIDRMTEGWMGATEIVADETDFEQDSLVRHDLWYLPPVPGHLYVTGWDVGLVNDATVGTTIDVTDDTHHVVAFERFYKMGEDEQQERILARKFHYPGWTVYDKTGLGLPMYLNLLQANGGEDIIGVAITRTTKPAMIGELKRSLAFGILKSGIGPLADELGEYRLKDEQLKQDCVMSVAMAEHTSRHLDLNQELSMDDRVDVSQAYGGW